MFTVSISQHGNSTDLQSFAVLTEAQSFAQKEKARNGEHPDFRNAEWSISDDEGACWPTTPTAYTVAFQDDNWSFWRDGDEIPEGWTIWESGLSWEAAHDAINA